jgi:hypothetical protein
MPEESFRFYDAGLKLLWDTTKKKTKVQVNFLTMNNGFGFYGDLIDLPQSKPVN